MTEAIAARAFEPFVTTKAEGKGTGLGKGAIARRRFRAPLSLSAAPGKGGTFT